MCSDSLCNSLLVQRDEAEKTVISDKPLSQEKSIALVRSNFVQEMHTCKQSLNGCKGFT